MMKDRLKGLIAGILILVFVFWETDYSGWIIAAIGVLLILHSLLIKKSGIKPVVVKNVVKRASKKKKRR